MNDIISTILNYYLLNNTMTILAINSFKTQVVKIMNTRQIFWKCTGNVYVNQLLEFIQKFLWCYLYASKGYRMPGKMIKTKNSIVIKPLLKIIQLKMFACFENRLTLLSVAL